MFELHSQHILKGFYESWSCFWKNYKLIHEEENVYDD